MSEEGLGGVFRLILSQDGFLTPFLHHRHIDSIFGRQTVFSVHIMAYDPEIRH